EREALENLSTLVMLMLISMLLMWSQPIQMLLFWARLRWKGACLLRQNMSKNSASQPQWTIFSTTRHALWITFSTLILELGIGHVMQIFLRITKTFPGS